MAITLASKAPSGVMRYSWTPPVLPGDSIESASLAITDGTIVIDSYGIDGETVSFFVSGGVEGETATIEASAVTSQGETLPETLYLPVRTRAKALGNTVASVVSYALRPIVGLGNVATADEQDDARETLDDILTAWAEQGADLQVKLPTDPADVLYVPDYAISAMKAALRVRIAGLYGKPVDVEDFRAAQRGLQIIKQALVSDARENEYY